MCKLIATLLTLALLAACSREGEHSGSCRHIPPPDIFQLHGPNLQLSKIEEEMQPLARRGDLDKGTFAAKTVASWKEMKSSHQRGDTIREFTMSKGSAGGYALIRGQCLVLAFVTWRSVL